MNLPIGLVALGLFITCTGNLPPCAARTSPIGLHQAAGAGYNAVQGKYLNSYKSSLLRRPSGGTSATAKVRVTDGVNGHLTYRAAVVEFKVNNTFLLNPDISQATGRMLSNLVGFENAVKSAVKEGVQIIVFPEYGIIGGGFLSRDETLFFLEQIPDIPSPEPINPCINSSFQDRPILKNLSCLAREYKIVVVANMGDKQPCHSSPNRTCPPNGWYQFNTDVAFDEDGTLPAKYHKKHLFWPETLWFDASNSTSCVSFSTSFGIKFGMFTCFDILYPDPTNCLLRNNVEHFVFPTEWGSEYPYYMSIEIQQSWSWKHSVNLLAANVHNPHPIFDFYSTGSGLYSSGDAMDYYISGVEFQLATGHMVIADLPVDPRKVQPHSQKGNRSDIGNVGAKRASATFALLQNSRGSVSVSYNSPDLGRELQCVVEYNMHNSTNGDTYGIGAFIRYTSKDPTYAYAVCTLCKCANDSVESCGQPVEYYEASTMFKEVRLSGNFPKGSEILVTLLGDHLKLIDLSMVGQMGEGVFVINGLNEPLLAFSLWSGIYNSSVVS